MSFILFRMILLNTFPEMDSRVIPLYFAQLLRSPFFGSLMKYPSFHSDGTCSSYQIFLKRVWSISTIVSMSALSASAGILSGPVALLFLSCLIAFWISSFMELLQLASRYQLAGCLVGLRGLVYLATPGSVPSICFSVLPLQGWPFHFCFLQASPVC